jgi:hypothetical protein
LWGNQQSKLQETLQQLNESMVQVVHEANTAANAQDLTGPLSNMKPAFDACTFCSNGVAEVGNIS